MRIQVQSQDYSENTGFEYIVGLHLTGIWSPQSKVEETKEWQLPLTGSYHMDTKELDEESMFHLRTNHSKRKRTIDKGQGHSWTRNSASIISSSRETWHWRTPDSHKVHQWDSYSFIQERYGQADMECFSNTVLSQKVPFWQCEGFRKGLNKYSSLTKISKSYKGQKTCKELNIYVCSLIFLKLNVLVNKIDRFHLASLAPWLNDDPWTMKSQFDFRLGDMPGFGLCTSRGHAGGSQMMIVSQWGFYFSLPSSLWNQ